MIFTFFPTKIKKLKRFKDSFQKKEIKKIIYKFFKLNSNFLGFK